MRGYYEARLSQDLMLTKGEAYDVSYEYDHASRIIKETVTGSINRVIAYTYDVNDNISTEIINVDSKVITKTYTYDESNNITSVAIVVS